MSPQPAPSSAPLHCPDGTYIGLDNSFDEESSTGPSTDLKCIVCHLGKYSEGSPATSCYDCHPGKYGKYSGPSYMPYNSVTCSNCSAGRYNDGYGKSGDGYDVCQPCPGNTYAGTGGLSKCRDCPANSYSSIGSTQCLSYPTLAPTSARPTLPIDFYGDTNSLVSLWVESTSMQRGESAVAIVTIAALLLFLIRRVLGVCRGRSIGEGSDIDTDWQERAQIEMAVAVGEGALGSRAVPAEYASIDSSEKEGV